jgi:GAF domain-containing protein
MITVPPIVHDMVRLAGEAAKSEACSLFLLNRDSELLHPAVVIGLPETYVRGIGSVRVGTQCCGRAVAERRPWIVEDMLTDPLFAEGRAAAQASKVRAAFSVPVIAPDQTVLGSLACHYFKPFRPSEYDIERNRIFAQLIGFALREQAHVEAASRS